MKRILILLLAVMQTSLLLATGHAGDYIFINGEEWELLDKPLNKDSAVYANLMKFLPEGRSVSTANWDGYTAYWTVIDGKIYLQKIDVHMYSSHDNEEYTLVYEADSLRNLFVSYYDGQGILAKWLNGDVRSGRGKVIRYFHSGFNRNMEEECIMSIYGGTIVNSMLYHNYKKDGFSLASGQQELEKRFPFNRFPELKEKGISFLMRDFKVSPEGKLLDCHVQARLPGARDFLKEQQHPYIKAYKAVLSDIHPWEVLYINGEYTVAFPSYIMPLKYHTVK